MKYDDGLIHYMDGKRVKVIDVYGSASIDNLRLSIKVFEDISRGSYSSNIAIIKKAAGRISVWTYPGNRLIGTTSDIDINRELYIKDQLLASIYPGEQVAGEMMKFKMFVMLD